MELTGTPFAEAPAPFTAEESRDIMLACASFPHFIEKIFPASFEGETFVMADRDRHPFSLSRLHYMWAGFAQKYPRLCVMAPRLHLKSTIMNHAFTLWQIFKAWAFVDGIVVSYKEDLARDHVKIAKRLAKANRYFRFFQDLKPRSEHVISFVCGFGTGETWHAAVQGIGVMGAKRGLHPKFVICDDILSDYTNPLEPAAIAKINSVFNNVIQSLPGPDDPLIVVGTPQSYDDTLYKLRANDEFFWIRCPAETDQADPERVAWPERFDRRVLRLIRRRVGRTAYQVEYLLVPLMAVNSLLPREAVELCVEPGLQAFSLDEPFENPDGWPVYGGMDIGKEVHPTHIAISVQAPDGTLVQVYQRFVDHMKYGQQAKLVNRLMEHFNVSRFYYDSTRAELDERGLSRRAYGRKFTKQRKPQLALLLERRIFAGPDEAGLVLLPDPRQVSQICAVNPQLKSLETSEGHGDSFWSNALMVQAAEDGPAMTVLGDVNEIFGGQRGRPVTGLPRGFESGQ
jgi:hypothetical protein